MQFEFSVSKAGQIASSGIVFLNGILDAGVIQGGETAIVRGLPERYITIKSVALINSGEILPNELTLSIEEPNFPLSELEGTVLISGAN